MKVAFFQPYLATWRLVFLERYVNYTDHQLLIYDGGYKPKNDEKSVSGNTTNISISKLWSLPFSVNIKGQSYPVYFSPFLLFKLLKDRPNIVITEGEINFLNVASIYVYCAITRSKYIWWSLGKVRTRKRTFVNAVLDPLVNFFLHGASAIICRNTLAADYYVNVKDVDKDRVFMAPNSMDEIRALSEVDDTAVELERIRNGRKIILYVGALTSAKRPDDLLRAFKKLRESGRNDIALWYVGDGPLRCQLELSAEREMSEGVCTFFGSQFEGVGNYFSVANLVAVPGLGGLVINHAMIFGNPVISTLADGTELDLIHNGKNGFIVPTSDIEALSEAILKIVDSSEYKSMCDYSLKLISDKWNMGIMMEQFERAIIYSKTR